MRGQIARCTAWVFDLDGTLTVPVHDFDAIRRDLGLPMGQPILEQLALLPADEAEPKRARLDGLERDLARRSTPAEGALSLVRSLARRGARLGILTRNTRANARLTLDAIGVGAQFADVDVLGRDEARPKPHPAGVQELLARWGLQPQQGVMVGDYRFDLEAGRAAGVWTVHVESSGEHPWPELTDLGVRSLGDLV